MCGHDGQVELAGERKVPLVARRHRHDGASAVTHQHIVGNPHGDGMSGQRIDRCGAGEYAGFLAVGRLAVELIFCRSSHAILGYGGTVVGRGERVGQGMLGGEHHKRCAKQGVGAGGEHLNGASMTCEIDPSTGRSANPVALHQLDRLWPIEPIEIGQKAITVGSDPHHPLLHISLEDGEAANVALAVGGDFLVREHRTHTGAPVDGKFGHVHQPELVDQEALLDL